MFPAGHISLVEVHEHYKHSLWNNSFPARELGDKGWFCSFPAEIAHGHFDRLDQVRRIEWQGLIGSFVGPHSDLYQAAGIDAKIHNSKVSVGRVSFLERVFLNTKVVAGLGEYRDTIVDRTPVVARRGFEDCLGSRPLPSSAG